MNWYKFAQQQQQVAVQQTVAKPTSLEDLIKKAQEHHVLPQAIQQFAGDIGYNPNYIQQLINNGKINNAQNTDPIIANNIGKFEQHLSQALKDAGMDEGINMQYRVEQEIRSL